MGYRPLRRLSIDTYAVPKRDVVERQVRGGHYAVRMRFIAALYRFVIAFFCFAGTYEAWLSGIGNRWVFFTVQTNVLLGVVMLWAGAATLLKGIQPPAWIKGALTLNIIVTGLVAWFVLPPSDPATTAFAFGVMTTTMAHIIVPIMASVDFLVFDPHRRFPWHYTLSWLIYFPFYLAFVLIRAQIWPHSGPGASGNPYPYGFIDLQALGWQRTALNCVEYLGAFFVLALVLFLIDRILPKRTPLTVL
ncbi:MAG: Pr6Pr family membrane protein [Bifidobacterium crudilactis]|jgi:hypothetical protein|nr:Pr6Pr family membrane protein [Bifidobacterium crudilactis]